VVFQVVHFFNTPPDVSDEQLLQVFRDYGVAPPHTISKFPLKSERLVRYTHHTIS
jgi:heterogeneous nuclear ribonucleoprotein L